MLGPTPDDCVDRWRKAEARACAEDQEDLPRGRERWVVVVVVPDNAAVVVLTHHCIHLDAYGTDAVAVGEAFGSTFAV